MNILLNFVSFIVILGIMILAHELGHFIVARLFKIRVETFSIGFGKRLFGFTKGDVDYRISVFPIGGYVKLAGEQVGEAVTGAPDEFLSRPRWQRSLVMLAGPMMNFLLAIFLLTFNYSIGIDVPRFYHAPPVVGDVISGSPAQKIGLKAGDQIISIGGSKVKDWSEFQMLSISFSKQSVDLVFKKNGEIFRRTISLRETLIDPSEITGILPFIPAKIASIEKGFPAEKAGLKPGDEIVSASCNGKRAIGYIQIAHLIQENKGNPITFRIRRGNRFIEKNIIPTASPNDPQKKTGFIGFALDFKYIKEQYSLLNAFLKSLKDNLRFVELTYKILGKVIVGKLSIRQFSGPIGIAKASGEAVKSRSITVIFSFMALISMNLAVLNLLPIPVLDGGMLFLLIIEMLLHRDLPMNLKEKAIQLGFLILIVFMAVVIFFDILKTLG